MSNIVTEVFSAGYRLINGDTLNKAFGHVNAVFAGTTQVLLHSTTADGLTATPSGTQSNALLLTAGINRITTVGTAGDSVKLPPSQPGIEIDVINDAASNSMQVYGSGTDTINDVATATGVAQAAGKSAAYYCPVAGKWYRNLSA